MLGETFVNDCSQLLAQILLQARHFTEVQKSVGRKMYDEDINIGLFSNCPLLLSISKTMRGTC